MPTSALYHSLCASSISKFLSEPELEMMIKHGQLISYKASETILRQGKESHGIYIIMSGDVLVSAKTLSEGIAHFETLGPGNVLGEISYIEKIPCTASCIANNDTKCLFLSEVFFEMLSAYSPEIKYKLFNAISIQVYDRLQKMHDKITAVMSNTDMMSQSFFGEFIHSLTKPVEISAEEVTDVIHKLHHHPMFNQFTKEEMNELLKQMILLKTPKNCTLIHSSDKEVACYIVLQGAVQSSIMHNKKIAKLSVIGPATLFTSVSLIGQQSPFSITFTTCEKAILFKLSDSALANIQNNNSVLWYKLFNLILRSLVTLEKSIDKLDIRLNIETYNR